MKVHILLASLVALTLPLNAGFAQQGNRNQMRIHNQQADSLNKRQWAKRPDWREYRNFDFDRPEEGERVYYADRYYRNGRFYSPQSLGRLDRVYRGSDGRYYCRRPDGTTGLVKGASDKIFASKLDRGESNMVGTLIGANSNPLVDGGGLPCR